VDACYDALGEGVGVGVGGRIRRRCIKKRGHEGEKG
jgi:hypothetical protein